MLRLVFFGKMFQEDACETPDTNTSEITRLRLDDIKSIPSLQRCSTSLLIVVDTPNVVQLLSLLPRYIGAHVPGVCERKQRLVIHILDVLLPFLLSIMSWLNSFHILCSHLLNEVCNKFDL